MPSKERPLRLTARGDDAREYHYLVKTGDDLRTDQRIQQLLGILNGSLAADSAAATRRLAVRTYKVLPLQPRLGLIEWLDNTETLRGFIGSAGPEFEKLCGKARKLHVRQMQARSGLGSDIPQVLHGPYAERAERAEVVEDFQKRAAILPPDLLRRAVYRLSAGPESFVRLRSQLSESHALLSTAGWLLAVGDRNLGNLLVSLHDGAMVGIDFGIAFGAAAFLPVPELVPFRMTPQLVGLTAPLGTSGAVRQTMCVALEALRRCHQLLAATLEVFVREPTLDTQLSRRAGGRTEYARECVAAACGRLVGDHPCANLSQLLQAAPLSPGLRDTLVVSARGRPGLDPRAGLADHGLSVQQQVTALLDLATDPYILGLTWSYWDAYV